MKNLGAYFVFVLFTCCNPFSAAAQIQLHTEDLPRFYEAFDSVLTTSDSTRQIDFINKLYVDKASKGLKNFMVLRGGNPVDWRQMMLRDKDALRQKRPWILSVQSQQAIIAKKLRRFKKLYPEFRNGEVYFCVGINNSGGTIDNTTVYIGTEVVASDKDNWALSMVLHEFAHTQQWTQRNITQLRSNDSMANVYLSTHTQLLGKCLEEGMADFIAELVNGESLAKTHPNGHTAFGLKHEQEIWDAFRQEMFQVFEYEKGWLYAAREFQGQKVKDLGYFVGHQICRSYYNKAKNKKKALNEMLSLNLTDENARQFLLDSGYMAASPKPINQKQQ